MSISHQRSLAGINPPSKSYLSFTDTATTVAQNDDPAITIGPTVAGFVANDFPLSVLQHGMISGTPTIDSIWTLPLGTTLLSNLTQFNNVDVGDGFEFIIRNQALPGSGFQITLAVDVGVTADSDANLVIQPGTWSKYILRCDDPANTVALADFEIFQVGSGAADGGAATTGYLSASATTIGAASALTVTPAALANLTFTVGVGVAEAVGAAVAGLVATSSTFTVANAGVYKIDLGVSGNSSAAQNVILQVAVGAVVNVQEVGRDDAAAAADGISISGSIILPLAANAVLSLFGSVDAATSNFTVIAASINIVRLA